MRKKAPTKSEKVDVVQNVFRQLPERKLLISVEAKDFIIDEVTDSYAAMVNLSRDEIVHRPYFEVFPSPTEGNAIETSNLEKAFRKVVISKEPQVQHVFRHDITDPADSDKSLERYWRTTLYPIFDATGAVAKILQVSSNATQEVIASRELEEAKHHLEEALMAGSVGTWTWDVVSGVVVGNDELAEEFGLDVELTKKGITFSHFMSKVHKSDRERVELALQRAIDTGGTFDTEFRANTNKWVIGRGRMLEIEGVRRFSGVTLDVTERRDLQMQIDLAKRQDQLNRAEAKMLQQRNEELEAITRTKDEFVALASHQLRTPATAVKQYLGMVLQGYIGDISDMQRGMLEKAFESNERQIEIINQILNAARADTGKLIITRQMTNITNLVKSVAEDTRSTFAQAGQHFSAKIPKTQISACVDEGYLRMVIENLLSNASKYTDDGGEIEVSLSETKTTVSIRVIDSGVGIAADDQIKLFQKFSRIHNPLSIKAGGSGIGLYLVAEIVRLHDGKVVVQSTEGKGTEFKVVLPKKDCSLL